MTSEFSIFLFELLSTTTMEKFRLEQKENDQFSIFDLHQYVLQVLAQNYSQTVSTLHIFLIIVWSLAEQCQFSALREHLFQ